MGSAVAQLKRLRGRSLREVRERGRQEIAKLRDRMSGAGDRELSDDAFLREIASTDRRATALATAGAVLERLRDARDAAGSPLPVLARRDGVVAVMQSRFDAERRAIVARADRAIAGRFDLLGFEGLDFGDPVDWRLEPTTGKRTPLDHWSTIAYLDPAVAGDKKVTWELNRHAHFVTLGQAYWLTGDARYAEAFVAHTNAWTEANPPGYGINWASSLEVAFRSIAWTWALHMFADAPGVDEPFVLRALKSLAAHGRHVASYLSHYFSPNTHLTGEALGLLYLGTAFPELRRARAWRATALRILVEQLDTQVRPDGVYFEQTTYYHRYTADFYTHFVALAAASGDELPAVVREKLVLLLDHLAWIARPDGASPVIGDDDGGRLLALGVRPSNDWRDTLATGATLFGRADWRHVAGNAASETLWLLGPEAISRYDAIVPAAPDATARAFPDGGLYVVRDDWSPEACYAIVDCGPHGALGCAHAHADALSIELAAGGVAWIVDPGTFTYTGDAALRDAFRTTAAHNTAVVDGEPQSIPGGPFRWERTATSSPAAFVAGESCDYFAGSHDGYARLADPVIHSRAALFVKAGDERPGYLVVRDAFAARGSHRYALRFHLAPGRSASARPGAIEATADGGRRLSIAARSEAELSTSVEQSWVSPTYGRREPAAVALVETSGRGPHEIVTVLAPWSGDARPSVVRTGDGVTVACGGVLDAIVFGADRASAVCGPLHASGAVAWGRFVDGATARLWLGRGREIETEAVTFRSHEDVESVSVRVSLDAVDVSVRGASRFELDVRARVAAVVVDGRRFEAGGAPRRFAFAASGDGWTED